MASIDSKMIDVLFVVGSQPPEACGVGGYVQRLSHELNQSSEMVQSEILHKGPWCLSAIFGQLKKIIRFQKTHPNPIIHFQYPSIGFGRSLTVPLLSIACRMIGMRVVSTIHEFSQVHVLRRLASLPIAVSSHAVIVSNEYERREVCKILVFCQKKISVIPVGSSIAVGRGQKEAEVGPITYFGLLRPEKGIEKFIDVANLAAAKVPDVKFRIIGAHDPRFIDYALHLKDSVRGENVEWILNKEENQVADLLSQTNYTYFPFPDGASDRRTSLLAAIANGAAALTTSYRFTPDSMIRSLEPLKIDHSPTEALERILKDISNKERVASLQKAALSLSLNYGWPNLVSRHLAVYRSALSN